MAVFVESSTLAVADAMAAAGVPAGSDSGPPTPEVLARPPRDADPPAESGVHPDVFRQALAHCAAGVVVVTVANGPTGFTASSFTSVSMDPPLVSFCVDRRAGCWSRLRDADRFTVNVLTERQGRVAARFATRGVDRFAPPTRWHAAPDGSPLVDGAAAYLWCRRHLVLPLGDHFLVVGLLVDAYHGATSAPLLYHQGHYGRFEPTG